MSVCETDKLVSSGEVPYVEIMLQRYTWGPRQNPWFIMLNVFQLFKAVLTQNVYGKISPVSNISWFKV